MRVERSELAVPASNWGMIEKAVASEADFIFLDLEDSVAPSEKIPSRKNVIRAMRELNWGTKPTLYRMNALDTPYFYRDIIEIVEEAGDVLDMIMVPKVRCPEDLYTVDTMLTQIEANVGLEHGKIKLEAQIETAEGLINADRIAKQSSRLETLIYGPGDYTANVHMPAVSIGSMDEWDEQYPGHRFHYVMHRIVVAARAAGVKAMDGPFANFRDLDGYRKACVMARGLGYDGKWAIHPSQIQVANEVFSPTGKELEWAQRVVDAYEEANAAGSGAISVDNKMIDAASIKMAQTTIELARQAGMV